jgi:tetratricopeptide (TPR) repeat protein
MQRVPSDSKENGSPGRKEALPQEWDTEEAAASADPVDEDILSRLDRLETRLDAFESTCYSFLLYANQLSERTVSFFEDIFGLGREDLARIHDRLGINYNNKGDFGRAIESFRKLVDLSRTAAACFKLGVAYDNNGNLHEAIESLRAAVELDPAYLKAHYKLSDVYARMENFGEAVRCLKQAVDVAPDNAETHFRLGTVHNARGSYDDAIASFNRVLSLAPDHPGIHQSLGLAYEQKGEHNRAIEYFKKSI